MNILPLFFTLLVFFVFFSVLILAGLRAIREARWEKFKRALQRRSVVEARSISRKLAPLRSQAEEELLENILKETGHSELLGFFGVQLRPKKGRTSYTLEDRDGS